jgi:hypothetical protein
MAKKEGAVPRLGDRVAEGLAVRKGAPPVVFSVQPDSFIVVDSPDALKAWEADVRKFLGVDLRGMAAGAGTESCSAGCSDDCDLA